jgi:type IV secretory pathway component VirB8
MNKQPPQSPPEAPPHDADEYLEIADKVRTGEYFREAQSMYDIRVHDPMSERYFYILITALSLMSFVVTYSAMKSLYPLEKEIPFAISANDLANDVPRIRPLIESKGEDPSHALLRFLVNNYVISYESYDIDTVERNASGVRSQSATEVFSDYQRLMDPRNPESPIALYQRHSTREIKVISSFIPDPEEALMEIIYEATVTSKTDVKKTRWQADVGFSYNGLALDEETGKVTPIEFKVISYRTKRLQDGQ